MLVDEAHEIGQAIWQTGEELGETLRSLGERIDVVDVKQALTTKALTTKKTWRNPAPFAVGGLMILLGFWFLRHRRADSKER